MSIHSSVTRTASSKLPTLHGVFNIIVYHSHSDMREHVALLLGKLASPVLTRIHSQCLTGDTLGSLTCDCGEQLRMSMEMIRQNSSGVLLYLNQEGRGIGLSNKIKAYAHQARGLDTVEANSALGFAPDLRDYAVAAHMLHDLGIREVSLLTNNPGKIRALRTHGIQVVKRIPLETIPTANNRSYLSIKKRKMGHKLKSV
ncbi:MAG: GTP cyclohydrolase II [bacterium]|nr:GTP cyclohydrolase II [bacterium]